MNHQWIFLSIKFVFETAALCFLLSYVVSRNVRQSLRKIAGKGYIFLISGIFQELIYMKLDPSFFSALYVFWNMAVLWFWWRMEIHRERRFSGIWISYILIYFQLCQLLVTCLIYAIPFWAEQIEGFGVRENIVSTLFIWLFSAVSAAFSLSRLPDNYVMTLGETMWGHIFFWFIFVAEQVLTKVLIPNQRYVNVAVAVFALLYINVQLYYLSFMQAAKERNEKMEQMIINQQYIIQLQHYDEIHTLYKKLREIRHDTNNQLLYIEQMLREEKYGDLKQYFGEMKKELSPALEMEDYGNKLINAVLWSKGEAARREGIPMDINAAVPENIPVKGHHICSLLGNLLDNAIEGSRDVEEPYIHLTLQMRQSYLYCCICNRVNADIMRDNPALNTTKEDALNHGYGIPAVKKIAEHYHGMVDFTMQNGEFQATVMLLCED